MLSTFGTQPAIWAGFFLEIIRSLMMRVGQPLVVAGAVGNLSQGHIDQSKFFVLMFLVLGVCGLVVGVVGDLVSTQAENRFYARNIVNYYNKLTTKDMAFYRDHQSGYLVSLFRQYLDSLMMLTRFLRGTGVRNAVSLVLPAFVLGSINFKLGLVAVSIIVLQVAYIIWASGRVNVYRTRTHEIYRKITGEVADVITNITAYKSSGAELKAQHRMQQLANEETVVFWDRRKRDILYDLPRDLLTSIGLTVAFLIVVTGDLGSGSVGLIVLTITYMFQISRTVGDLPNTITQHDDLITKAYPTFAYLGSDHETIRDPEHPKKLKVADGAIELDKVTFSYPERSGSGRRIPVFENLSISIKGGEQVGVVGLSGAGKSTLAGLLMRFDEVDDGAIRIDGTDIRDVRQNDLRSHIAYVPQEPMLFHRSIHDNIAYFNVEATQADVERAAKAAHAHQFISRLPSGYDSMVGERGVKLSGGQKQRVVIARAILKNAPIMVFDEATSALDSESERIIQRALPEIIGRHTAIVIAHRLSTIAGLDRILVMHEGRIIEEGTHDELLALDGRYAGLWAKQAHIEQVAA